MDRGIFVAINIFFFIFRVFCYYEISSLWLDLIKGKKGYYLNFYREGLIISSRFIDVPLTSFFSDLSSYTVKLLVAWCMQSQSLRSTYRSEHSFLCNSIFGIPNVIKLVLYTFYLETAHSITNSSRKVIKKEFNNCNYYSTTNKLDVLFSTDPFNIFAQSHSRISLSICFCSCVVKSFARCSLGFCLCQLVLIWYSEKLMI